MHGCPWHGAPWHCMASDVPSARQTIALRMAAARHARHGAAWARSMRTAQPAWTAHAHSRAHSLGSSTSHTLHPSLTVRPTLTRWGQCFPKHPEFSLSARPCFHVFTTLPCRTGTHPLDFTPLQHGAPALQAAMMFQIFKGQTAVQVLCVFGAGLERMPLCIVQSC